MPKIFISYRRDDSILEASIIRDRLASHFGEPDIFFDIDGIPAGRNFRLHIDSAVGACDYLIAVVGKQWLAAVDEEGQPRLNDPNDWVRLEIESALRRDIPVIPVLLHNIRMPKRGQLPEGLAEFAERQARSVRPPGDFNHDVDRLILEIDRQEKHRSEAQRLAEQKRESQQAPQIEEERRQKEVAALAEKDRRNQEAQEQASAEQERRRQLRQLPPRSPRRLQAKSKSETRPVGALRRRFVFVLVGCIIDVPLALAFIVAKGIETILFAGPAMVVLGLALLFLSRRDRRSIATAAVQIAIPVSIFLLIYLKEWGKGDAETPVTCIGVAALFVTVPLGIWALLGDRKSSRAADNDLA
jgi:hypothetical protein